jgi:DNA (cytosine-5)-methyltransferase 1
LIAANSGEVGYCLTASAQQCLDAEIETLIAGAHILKAEGFDASEDGTGRGIPLVPISFDSKGSQVQTDQSGAAPTLRAMGHADSHQNGGGQLAVAFQDRFRGDDGRGYDRPPPASVEASGTLETVKPWNVATRWAVRRLTPMECERLQGFPDGYTQVPNRGKPAADGPRYKALGNSMATNAMEYIGRRIELVRGLMGGVQ